MAAVGATATLDKRAAGRRRQLGIAQRLEGQVTRAARAGLAVGRAPCAARYRTSAGARPDMGADNGAKLFYYF